MIFGFVFLQLKVQRKIVLGTTLMAIRWWGNFSLDDTEFLKRFTT